MLCCLLTFLGEVDVKNISNDFDELPVMSSPFICGIVKSSLVRKNRDFFLTYVGTTTAPNIQKKVQFWEAKLFASKAKIYVFEIILNRVAVKGLSI